MQITVESPSSLERKLIIQVPAGRYNDTYQKKLKELRTKVRVDGFRPGKAPDRVIKLQFGDSIEKEIMSDLQQAAIQEAITKENLSALSIPELDCNREDDGVIHITALVEVKPEVELKKLDKIKVKRPKVEVTDADIDKRIYELRKRFATWNEVDRKSKDGDQVIIDFEGSVDGELFDGGTATDFSLELGSNQMIDGFESGLVGLKAGDEKKLKVKFPKEYHSPNLSGRNAVFATKVKRVSELVLPEVNDEFAVSVGVKEGGVETLKNDMRTRLEKEVENIIKSNERQQVAEKLLELHSIEVPKTLIRQELDHLRQDFVARFPDFNTGKARLEAMPEGHFDKQAEKRAKTGLLFSEVVKKFDLKPDQDRIREMVDRVASNYHDPEAVRESYLKNERLLAELSGAVLEEQAVEKLLQEGQVTETTMSFEKLLEQE